MSVMKNDRPKKSPPKIFEPCDACGMTGCDPAYDGYDVHCSRCGGKGYIFTVDFVEALNEIVVHAKFTHPDWVGQFYG